MGRAVKFPSYIQPIKFPVFGISRCIAPPSSSTSSSPAKHTINSIVALCGGGGSARTGVGNQITINFGESQGIKVSLENSYQKSITIFTGDQTPIAVCCTIVQNHWWVLAAIGDSIQLYGAPLASVNQDHGEDVKVVKGTNKGDDGDSRYLLAKKALPNCTNMEGAACVDISLSKQYCVTGTDRGDIYVHSIRPLPTESDTSLTFEFHQIAALAKQHERAVCSVTFHPFAEDVCISSAKDGTARVWDISAQTCSHVLKCLPHLMNDPNPPPAKKLKVGQVLVRGCGFDHSGNVYTVTSGRRGAAFCSKWSLGQKNDVTELKRVLISVNPVSAMKMSGDTKTLVLGNVDGDILVVSTDNLSVVKTFPNVHDLPITAITSRPPSMDMSKNDAKVDAWCDFDAISASADNKLAFLSRKTKPLSWFFIEVCLAVLVVLLSIMYTSYSICQTELLQIVFNPSSDIDSYNDVNHTYKECMIGSVLAPEGTPGLAFIPH